MDNSRPTREIGGSNAKEFSMVCSNWIDMDDGSLVVVVLWWQEYDDTVQVDGFDIGNGVSKSLIRHNI
ncbi:hypothetical protein LINPERPRIM_LOCUS2715 [Linum perenne]